MKYELNFWYDTEERVYGKGRPVLLPESIKACVVGVALVAKPDIDADGDCRTVAEYVLPDRYTEFTASRWVDEAYRNQCELPFEILRSWLELMEPGVRG